MTTATRALAAIAAAGLLSSCIITTDSGCDTNGDCILSGETCVDGECVDRGTTCDDPGDCLSGQTCESGVCRDTGPECVSNGDCPSGETCVGGTCVDRGTTCDDAADCLGGQTCVSGMCQETGPECSENGDCPGGETCVGGACVTIGSACDDPDDCPVGYTCDTTSGTCEALDVVLGWAWTLEAHSYAELGEDGFEWMCVWSNYGYPAAEATVRLLVDVDHDSTEDYYYDAECEWGSALTDPASDPASYEAGQDIWFAFQFIGYDGEVWAQSETWTAQTLALGTNDLGTVDFDWGDFGPLDVTLRWQTASGSSTYGDCAAPDPDVEILGYLLSYSTGEVADEVDIDTDPMDCTTSLSWLETEFDTYYLETDGEDATGYSVWGSLCYDLVVDDETSNAFSCDVLKTS
jgi:hypothetical protein